MEASYNWHRWQLRQFWQNRITLPNTETPECEGFTGLAGNGYEGVIRYGGAKRSLTRAVSAGWEI